MKLPNAAEAVIPREKLTDYLLSPLASGGKAVTFTTLGYTRDSWELLETHLRAQHLSTEAEEVQPSQFGRKFLIRADLKGPSGTTERIVSVWIIRNGEERPRLVTAYRDKRRS